ncbi:hypothetical protein ABT369_56940 [Dactylosporangium sp. NPDC000244]|uniref:hypothetical protein n=1 Tax=Dactylosporangium sp. NPDC000244 TaxID=3154365 RepID=UPI0033306F0A
MVVERADGHPAEHLDEHLVVVLAAELQPARRLGHLGFGGPLVAQAFQFLGQPRAARGRPAPGDRGRGLRVIAPAVRDEYVVRGLVFVGRVGVAEQVGGQADGLIDGGVDVEAVQRERLAGVGETPPHGAGHDLAVLLGDPDPCMAVVAGFEEGQQALRISPADALVDDAADQAVEISLDHGTEKHRSSEKKKRTR